jgi:hypothetical protein
MEYNKEHAQERALSTEYFKDQLQCMMGQGIPESVARMKLGNTLAIRTKHFCPPLRVAPMRCFVCRTTSSQCRMLSCVPRDGTTKCLLALLSLKRGVQPSRVSRIGVCKLRGCYVFKDRDGAPLPPKEQADLYFNKNKELAVWKQMSVMTQMQPLLHFLRPLLVPSPSKSPPPTLHRSSQRVGVVGACNTCS